MLKFIIPAICVISFLTGCKTTGEADLASAKLSYPPQPDIVEAEKFTKPIVRASLKDPDSLKNFKLEKMYKCYISKIEFTDNVSPKYNDGHWCFVYSFYGTNSYGGYVRGTEAFIFKDGVYIPLPISETVRKTGDVGTYFTGVGNR